MNSLIVHLALLLGSASDGRFLETQNDYGYAIFFSNLHSYVALNFADEHVITAPSRSQGPDNLKLGKSIPFTRLSRWVPQTMLAAI